MNWEIRPFGELYATPSRNGLMRPSKERGSGYKMINMGELFAYPIIKNPEMERVQVSDIELPKYRIEKGDLLFARQSLVLEGAGKCSIVAETEDPTVYESHLIRVRLNKELCDPFFYFHFFNSQVGAGFVQQIVNQVAAAGIRGSDLEKLKVIYPPLPVQQKVAAILSAYDDLIENNNKRIALLEKAAEEIYREWFIRMRFPGWEQVKFVKGIPEGWEIVDVKSLGRIVTGKTPSTKIAKYYNGDYLFIKTPNMHGNMFVYETDETLTEDGLLSQPSQTIPEGSICVSCIGTGGIVSITTSKCQTNQQINSLIPKDESDLEWAFYTLRYLKETIQLFGATGATMTNLSKGKFAALKILKPEDKYRKSYHELAKPMFSQIQAFLQSNRCLKQSRDLLLSHLISGKLSVEALDIRFPPSMIAQ